VEDEQCSSGLMRSPVLECDGSRLPKRATSLGAVAVGVMLVATAVTDGAGLDPIMRAVPGSELILVPFRYG
ncbi:MAG: hypothetical protein ACRDTC_09290, partial [Pseudonocardiaceae bacterium]